MEINIIGAGMAGLLATNMLRRHDINIYENQSKLPNNHYAVLRFKTPEVGNILGIQFKKVNMIKTYVPFRNVVADSLSYSRKTTGKYLSNRSIIAGTVQADRWIAPLNLIEQMAKNIHIHYNIKFDTFGKIPCISTMPMPSLMNILGYQDRGAFFSSVPGIVFCGTIQNCDAYVSVLFPGPEPYSRATITGDQLMIEFPNMEEIPESIDLAHAYFHLGLDDVVVLDGKFKKQPYFKITEINDSDRKKFQRWATVNHNIYSLGRYATWRPKLLLDDLIDDVRKIESWIVGGE
jgi:hypothetical protein